MPTGYTAKVQSGEITEFSDYAWDCARAFGALILLRDDSSAEIPTAFEPETKYHDEHLEAAKDSLTELQRLGAKECDKRAHEAYLSTVAEFKQRTKEREERRMRYKRMLEKVNAWEASSDNHTKFHEFMRDQLTESIAFDCDVKWDTHPEAQTGEEWRAASIACRS
jgi:hypothetical protein